MAAVLALTSGTNAFFGGNSEEDHHDIPIKITSRPSTHTSGLGNHLQSLHEAAGGQPDYIDKQL